MKNISILGSTGSIGRQTLEVADFLENVQVVGISANENINLLEEQIRKYKPKIAAVYDEALAKTLKIAVADTSTKIASGLEGLCQVSSMNEADTVVTSIVGVAGLVPTMAAIESGKNIALANKETLVTAGTIVTEAAKQHNVSILPVDSEHSAIFQCIGSHKTADLNKIIITASGGSFYGKTKNQLENVTINDALNHPNWSMGRKITIDSATLMNKGLEVIEAHFLFNIDYDNIEVIIHRESIIHSMVEFKDNSIIAQMGLPDMKLPIHYALCYPNRVPSVGKSLNWGDISSLSFSKPDFETFKCLPLAIYTGKQGGTMPAALNAANEAAVDLFLKGKIKFLQIAEIVEECISLHKNKLNPTLSDIISTDIEIKNGVYKTLC